MILILIDYMIILNSKFKFSNYFSFKDYIFSSHFNIFGVKPRIEILTHLFCSEYIL